MRKILLFLMCISFILTSKLYSQAYIEINSSSCSNNILATYNATYAGNIDGSSTDWNCPNMLDTTNSFQGCLVLINDGTSGISSGIGNPPLEIPKYSLGCDTSNYLTQDLSGKIAVIYRGTCEFGLKAYNAQIRGAIGVIIINHTGDAVELAGATYGTRVNIPVIMISRSNGDSLVSCIDTSCNNIIGTIGAYKIMGNAFNDFNNDCVKQSSEDGISNISATVNPGNYRVTTNNLGNWYIKSLPIGNYSITYDSAIYWSTQCSYVDTFSVSDTNVVSFTSSKGFKPNFGYASGYIYYDLNDNCILNSGEYALLNRRGIINPGGIIVESNNLNGFWHYDSLLFGNYTFTVDTNGYFYNTCNTPMNFIVNGTAQDSALKNSGVQSSKTCFEPHISVNMPSRRPCVSNQEISVKACNIPLTSVHIPNASAIIKLDTLITLTSASLPYVNLGNNTYSFDLDTLIPGQCAYFSLYTTISCSAILGQTLCIQANLLPADSCVFDSIPTSNIVGVEPCTLPWDNSSLSVNGWCQSDSIYFSVTNNGAPIVADMQCFSPVSVYVDGILQYTDSVLLQGGQTTLFSYPANGQTWILQTEQHPLHPGNSHPNAFVELCGDINNWTPGMVNTLPLDDADPIVDIFCGVVTASYDPNDKTGYPLGVGNDHFVAPNGKIDYVIRFQNTGTDTAFTVVVRDTLDVDLDIFSVQSGVSSHNYTFKMFGPRVLEWTFNNILLPDSTTDEPASNGFVTFTVNQNPNLPDGTVINNRVGIYFDFNAPIITNTTTHTINRGINYLLTINPSKTLSNKSLFIYPNPTKNILNIIVPDAQNLKIDIYGIDGKLIEHKTITKNTAIDVSKYQSGLYFINATTNKGEVFRNKFVKE